MKTFFNYLGRAFNVFFKVMRVFIIIYFLFVLAVGIFDPERFAQLDFSWWILFFLFDMWADKNVYNKEEKKCKGNCENCQKLNS